MDERNDIISKVRQFMQRHRIFLFLLIAWLLPRMALAQTDHRTYYSETDSLENLLATNPPHGAELVENEKKVFFYKNIMYFCSRYTLLDFRCR
jgi:hypothetical protein